MKKFNCTSGSINVIKYTHCDRSIVKKMKLKGVHLCSLYTKLLIFSITFCLCFLTKAAENDKIIFLNNTGQPDGSFIYSVMEGENLFLPFTIDSTVIGKSIKFYLTTFTGEQGDNLTVVPSILEMPELKPEGNGLTFKAGKPVQTLKLDVPELSTVSKYTGSLVVLRDNKILQTLPIILKRATVQLSAQLKADLESVTINNTRSFIYLFDEPATFTIPIRNISPDWQAKGIFLRLVEVTTPEGVNFNSDENIELSWNGKQCSNIWSSSLDGTNNSPVRNILPNHQSVLSGEFINLSPGEYSIKLAIAALNGNPEKEQQIVFKIKSRHNYLYAVVFLLIAIAISFVSHKFLDTQYSRSTLLQRIASVRPPWLREEANTLPVVSVRTILRQIEDRNKNIVTALFSSEDVMNSRIDKAEKIISILTRIRQIRERIRDWNADKMIRSRAEKILKEIIADMGWEIGDEKFISELNGRLDKLNNWFIPDQLHNLFWSDIKGDIDTIIELVKAEIFNKNEHKKIIEKLIKNIYTQKDMLDNEKKDKKLRREEMILNISHDYARLKILWECRVNNDVEAEEEMFGMLKSDNSALWPSIKEFWSKADDIIWKKLVDASKKQNGDGIKFTSPVINNIQPYYAYQPIHFKIYPEKPTLCNNYLFRYGLEYRWIISQIVEGERKVIIQPKTNVPELVQYLPVKGNYNISVKMFREGKGTDEIMMKDELEVQSSEDFGWRGIFRSAEITALVLAILFALISGLSSFYFNNPVFGTVKDYIALFIWGAGVDLGKNYLQKLQQSTTGKNQ